MLRCVRKARCYEVRKWSTKGIVVASWCGASSSGCWLALLHMAASSISSKAAHRPQTLPPSAPSWLLLNCPQINTSSVVLKKLMEGQEGQAGGDVAARSAAGRRRQTSSCAHICLHVQPRQLLLRAVLPLLLV